MSRLRLHPRLAAALIVLALLVKLLVPAGFMPAVSAGKMVVLVCTGTGPMRVVIDVPGKPAQPGDGAMQDQPCAFAGLMAPLLGGADPVQLIAALAFILALGFTALALLPLGQIAHLRPPLRGPPLPA